MRGAGWLCIPVILNVWIEGYLRFVMNWVAPILHLFSAAKKEFSHEQSLWLEERNDPTSLQPLFVSKFIGRGIWRLHN